MEAASLALRWCGSGSLRHWARPQSRLEFPVSVSMPQFPSIVAALCRAMEVAAFLRRIIIASHTDTIDHAWCGCVDLVDEFKWRPSCRDAKGV